MKVFIATDFTVEQYKDRFYYNSAFYTILKRYVNAFGKVVICTRVNLVSNQPDNLEDATEFIDKVVAVNGLIEGFTGSINQQMISEIKNCDLVIARVPSIIAYRAADCARKLKKPYLAESMGCAWDAYWNHGFVGKIIAPYMFCKMRRCVLKANYGLYVTERYLQSKYPCNGISINASNVNISTCDEDRIKEKLKRVQSLNMSSITLVTAAAVDVRYKGQEYVIKAIPLLNKCGIRVQYKLIGKGDRTFLETLARKKDITNQVKFLGQLSHDEVLTEMDNADIYIQPSLQEGLPRAMIEALSRGCICLGAATAGIPELIRSKFVFKRKSAKDIVRVIKELSDLNNIESEVQYNYEKSKEYDRDVLDLRRKEFFNFICAQIEQ